MFCVKKMKEQCVTFCFIKLDAKVSPISSGKEWLFCAELSSLLSKLIFTHIVSCWSSIHETVGKKHEIIIRNWTDELSHKLSNNLRIRILENEKFLRLFTWDFID